MTDCAKSSHFLPQPACLISSHLDKSHDFQTLFAFLEFKNHSATRSWSCFLYKMFEFFFLSWIRPHTRLNNMNTIFLLILFYYLNHMEFKFDLYQKISWNAIDELNIAIRSRNMPYLNMEYHMLYVESRKKFKVRSEKKTYYFMQL